jgi:hypothetical protein
VRDRLDIADIGYQGTERRAFCSPFFFAPERQKEEEKDLTQRAQRPERGGHGDGEFEDLVALDGMSVPWYIYTMVDGRNYD